MFNSYLFEADYNDQGRCDDLPGHDELARDALRNLVDADNDGNDDAGVDYLLKRASILATLALAAATNAREG